jgi:hypothetical protein
MQASSLGAVADLRPPSIQGIQLNVQILRKNLKKIVVLINFIPFFYHI